MPIISVIIPAYNAERTILETIASVQQQTFSDFELIVINDGSTDQTSELLITVKDHRLKIFSYRNSGPAAARNHGISHSTGNFISFLDADDLWTQDKLELQLAALQRHPEAGVAYSWTCYMSEDGKSFYAGESIKFEGNVYAQLLVRNFLDNGSNPLISKQAIESVKEFDTTLSASEDWDFYLRLAARWPFVLVHKPQVIYRQSSKGLSSNIDLMDNYCFLVLERAFQSAPPELQYLKNQSLATVHHYLTGICLARVTNAEEVKQAGQKLQMAIRLEPRTLLNRITQRYLIIWLLMRLLSPKVGKYFTRPVGIARSTIDPRLIS